MLNSITYRSSKHKVRINANPYNLFIRYEGKPKFLEFIDAKWCVKIGNKYCELENQKINFDFLIPKAKLNEKQRYAKQEIEPRFFAASIQTIEPLENQILKQLTNDKNNLINNNIKTLNVLLYQVFKDSNDTYNLCHSQEVHEFYNKEFISQNIYIINNSELINSYGERFVILNKEKYYEIIDKYLK